MSEAKKYPELRVGYRDDVRVDGFSVDPDSLEVNLGATGRPITIVIDLLRRAVLHDLEESSDFIPSEELSLCDYLRSQFKTTSIQEGSSAMAMKWVLWQAKIGIRPPRPTSFGRKRDIPKDIRVTYFLQGIDEVLEADDVVRFKGCGVENRNLI
ncbi:MAG TPA: hypothetical protein VFE47_11875 [Tepidisphaeraceae bacterium]|nr:hypothetical protein [Tepidisphaeraceae bacterium]